MRKEKVLVYCTICAKKAFPHAREILMTNAGAPKLTDLPKGWSSSGCYDKRNLTFWCPEHTPSG